MATSTDLTSLDLETIKDNLKTYLKSQSIFQDYDFDGSNMSVLLDILAYNTYQNNFYLNMIGNEMFLDSCLLRDSVVSHIKELNYLPRSFRSAYANVDVIITASNSESANATLTMPKGTSFTARFGSNNYTFTTDQNYVLGNESGKYYANNLLIYEGDYFTDSFIVNSDETQKYILSNERIDTTSIVVKVIEDNGSSILTYTYASSLFGLDSTSKVFFLQGAPDYKYEILFGDDVTGRKPKNNSIIEVEYRISSGELPNGLKVFTSDGAIDSQSNVVVNTNIAATGGAISESVESIKYNAPRAFTTQDRAVTTEDYETLLKANFAEVNEVVAYGGEEANPPQYGKVFVSVDLNNTDTLPRNKRIEYYNFLKSRTPLSIDPAFVDPVYMYVYLKSTVKYNINLTSLNESDIETLVTNAITTFNTNNLNGYKKKLRYSQIVTAIDDAHSSIVSNETDIWAMKEFIPSTSNYSNYDIDFGIVLADDLEEKGRTHSENEKNIVFSSQFIFKDDICILEDDGNGTLRLMTDNGGIHTTVEENVGSINYSTGLVQISNFKPDAFIGSQKIKLYARPVGKDIIAARNTILGIQSEDLVIEIDQVRE